MTWENISSSEWNSLTHCRCSVNVAPCQLLCFLRPGAGMYGCLVPPSHGSLRGLQTYRTSSVTFLGVNLRDEISYIF